MIEKWGAMELEGLGTVFLGAPEMLLMLKFLAREALNEDLKVLVLALSQEELDHHKPQKPSICKPRLWFLRF